MMSECFHRCQPAPSFQAVFTLAQSHYQWDPGWGVTESAALLSRWGVVSKNKPMEVCKCVYKWAPYDASAWSH